MTTDEVMDLYKSIYMFNKKTKMSYNTYYNWRRLGYIPLRSQERLEKITNGILKADKEGPR